MVLEHGGSHASAMGSDRLDCGEDRLHGGDAAEMGAAGGARPGPAGRSGRARSRRGSRPWSGRTVSCRARRTRSCARPRLMQRCSGARPPLEAMIAFIDEHLARSMGSSRSAMCCRSSPSTFYEHAARRRDPARLPARGTAGRDPAIRNPAGLGGEFPGLWRAQDLAAARRNGKGSRCSAAARPPG